MNKLIKSRYSVALWIKILRRLQYKYKQNIEEIVFNATSFISFLCSKIETIDFCFT